MQLDDYVKAGKIASEVRELARKTDWVGKTLYEICESVESEIKKRGGKCAFPVNASLNELAAHYTAEPNDPKMLTDRDLIKIDLGVQINGFIADTAVTISYDPQYEILVSTAEEALKTAMSMVKEGTKSSEIGKTIEKVVKQYNCKPIANLSGHSLEQYTIHAGKSIPNMWSIGSFSLSAKEAYACEPFVTTSNGLGFVREGKIKNIFGLVSRKKVKSEAANRLVEHIWNNYNMLPFALRWITKEWDEKEARAALDEAIKNKVVRAYPILVEANGQCVAQAEHTFIPTENGAIITTQ
ncbi:type II methionyl aminopeptidase [Candidatus Nitrosotenuis uzonensis]|uniref:Methionine aminopeptidase n=1 Tax=Candidatus Nitrosotenuis uzonensis TaxID=1407055 RepID=V6ARS8_9ARCH|nr:type II methionyl aminopeptidase [Candidatus Nitrosotenuis uzonensis]CDI05362.1 putative methionine aminopeptidase [Candidatus Nitrosotenuis uzonensis]